MQPKNVLVIMSDQHSPHVVGCYGNEIIETPNIDALADQGTRFEHACTPCPICVPARASLSTGRYVHDIENWDNAKPYIGTEAPSWGARLTEQGHSVVTLGKLHYRHVGDPTGFPDQRLSMHVLDGVGDLYALLRGDMPVRPQSRAHVLEAGIGESEYIRYDRAIAQESARFLREEASASDKPWVLFTSFTTPHFPLKVPAEYFDRYPPESLPWPIAGSPEDWPGHPAIVSHRARQALDTPIDDRDFRKAMAAYYGLVTFLDEQIGIVLQALAEAGLEKDTRIIYTSDHGEMLGEHGMWWKSSMYEASVSVPLVLAGPDVPVGKVVETNTSLIDLFPTIVTAAGGELAPEDADLPGTSLWELAEGPNQDRTVFSEFHTSPSPSAMYMVQNARYKYIHFVDHSPMLFDLTSDPDELVNLADDPAHADIVLARQRELMEIVDPVAADLRAKEDQQQRLNAAGGKEAVLAAGLKIPFTPAPSGVYTDFG